MTAPLSLPEAEQLAEATKTRIDEKLSILAGVFSPQAQSLAADRERVESDLAGLRLCMIDVDGVALKPHRVGRLGELYALFSASLIRAASLYGVSLPVGTPAREET